MKTTKFTLKHVGLLALVFLLGVSTPTFGITKYTTSSGDWNDGDIWNSALGTTRDARITAGHTVTLTSNER
jgi:hypothetical protein